MLFQALLVRALLEYSQNSESSVTHGIILVAGIFLTELMRSWTLALMWAVNYRTAARLRGAALTFAFNKILSLRSTKKISLGEVTDEDLVWEWEGRLVSTLAKSSSHCKATHSEGGGVISASAPFLFRSRKIR